ncbi:MAG: polysaccharide export protein [Gammaproteobacteria bacterium]|nr:polysaccharide export protein [Gammaproteobacteria bacterium]
MVQEAMVRKLTLLMLLTQLAGCSWAPGLMLSADDFEQDDSVNQESMPVTLIPITPSLIEKQPRSLLTVPPVNNATNLTTGYEYKVGPQDVLNIIVWEHPELTIPTGGQRSAEQDGHRVSSKGTIFYPYVGVVLVTGKTTEEIRNELTEKLSKYIRKPQLDVRVVDFNSQKVQVAGAVEKPDSYPISDVPLALSDVVNAAGGNNKNADIQSVILTRNGVNKRYNLLDRYYRGDTSEDVLLQNGDVIYVPANTVHKVFVMGEVAKPAALPLVDGQLTLADVLAASGIDQNAADPERIFVLRRGEDLNKPYAYLLDASEPGALIMATAFQLQALDVVFVSTADITRWSRTLTQLLPTVQTLWTIDRITAD